VNEELVDRKMKSTHYYLCLHPGGRIMVKVISRPEKDLMEREYGVYTDLDALPLEVQAALLGGRLREFLKLVEKIWTRRPKRIEGFSSDVLEERRDRGERGQRREPRGHREGHRRRCPGHLELGTRGL